MPLASAAYSVSLACLANCRNGNQGSFLTLLLAPTLTYSIARLTGDQQKAVKTTAFEVSHPSLMDSSAPLATSFCCMGSDWSV